MIGPIGYPDPLWQEIAALARDLNVLVNDNSAGDAPFSRKYEIVFPDKTVIPLPTPTEVLALLRGVKHERDVKVDSTPRRADAGALGITGGDSVSPCLFVFGKAVIERHDWTEFFESTENPHFNRNTPYDYCHRCGAIRVKEGIRK